MTGKFLQRLKNWIFETRTYASEKNGEIICRRDLGRWSVRVEGIDQTSSIVTALWRAALTRVPRTAKIRQALLLGTAAGGWLPLMKERFPGCRITTVEHDPVMIRIARELNVASGTGVSFVLDDAGSALKNLHGSFDLVLMDFFKGPTPSPLYSNPEFLTNLQKKLSGQGYLVVNVFRNEEHLANIRNYFSLWEVWKIRWNRFALFRHFGRGKEGDPLPQGFVHPKQSPAYIRGSLMAGFAYSMVGEGDRLGIQFRRGPFIFEEYTSDTEPEAHGGTRLSVVLWHPITRTDVPPGWHRLPYSFELVRLTGYAEITSPRYSENWTPHARRHLARWRSQSDVEIVEMSGAEYLESYKAAPKNSEAREIALAKITQNLAAKNRLRFFGARNVRSHKIVAGLCVLDLPELSESVHAAAFVLEEAKASSAGTGLIQHWFEECVRQNIRFLNFGSFWSRGNPKSWKGFSRFKSQFSVNYIRYPRVLFKIVFRR